VKWDDHRRITTYVCKLFNFDEETTRKISEASILPDKEPDYVIVRRKKRTYRKRVSHHSEEGLEMGLKYLKIARKEFVKKGDFETPLGRALHYFQDYVVGTEKKLWIFSFRSWEKHDQLEANLPERIDWKPAKEGMESKVYPHQILGTIRKRGKGETPEEVLNLAVYATALAVKMVVDPYVEGVEENYQKHLKIMLFISLLSFLSGLIALGLNLEGVLAGLFLVLVGYVLNIPFRRARFDYKWWKP